MEQYKVKEGTKAFCSNALYYNYACRFLKKVTFPITLIAIGEESFYYNNINTILFDDNIQYIGE